VTYRIAFGPRAGQKVLTLRGAVPRETAARQPLCADIDGFGLHATGTSGCSSSSGAVGFARGLSGLKRASLFSML
jgi:hypothetical protein